MNPGRYRNSLNLSRYQPVSKRNDIAHTDLSVAFRRVYISTGNCGQALYSGGCASFCRQGSRVLRGRWSGRERGAQRSGSGRSSTDGGHRCRKLAGRRHRPRHQVGGERFQRCRTGSGARRATRVHRLLGRRQ